VNKLVYRLKAIGVATEPQVTSALKEVGEDLLSKSRELAPVDTGKLRDTSSSEVKPGVGGPDLTVAFVQPYAIVQHEDLSLFHSKGQAKYLEEPLNENKGRYIEMIKDAGRRGLNG
jgi:hypothetical protein